MDQIFQIGKDACEKDMLATQKNTLVGIKKVNRIISYNKGHELNEISREQTGNKQIYSFFLNAELTELQTLDLKVQKS